jgi:hypothetical protein
MKRVFRRAVSGREGEAETVVSSTPAVRRVPSLRCAGGSDPLPFAREVLRSRFLRLIFFF